MIRDRHVMVRMNDIEFTKLEELARANGVKLTEWVRLATHIAHAQLQRDEAPEWPAPRLAKAA